MGRFTPIYKDRERAAVLRAGLDLDPPMRAPAIVKLAAAGELEDELGRLEPFEMPETTARANIRDERRRRLREHVDPDEKPEDVLDRIHKMTVRALERKATRALCASDVKHEEIREIAASEKALREAVKAQRSATKQKTDQAKPEDEPRKLSFIEQLARDHGDEPRPSDQAPI
jgi:hypothetical protein